MMAMIAKSGIFFNGENLSIMKLFYSLFGNNTKGIRTLKAIKIQDLASPWIIVAEKIKAIAIAMNRRAAGFLGEFSFLFAEASKLAEIARIKIPNQFPETW